MSKARRTSDPVRYAIYAVLVLMVIGASQINVIAGLGAAVISIIIAARIP